MSERPPGGGFGSFLFGVAVGAVLGALFAPEAGTATRRRLGGKLKDLRELAADGAEELGELLTAGAADEGGRAELTRRLEAARRGRRAAGAARRPPPESEDDEPVA